MRGRVALFVLLVVLAGCMGLGDDESSIPDGEAAKQGYDSLKSVEGTIEIRTSAGENDSNVTVHSVIRPKQEMARQEFLSPPGQAGDITVTNGSVTWIYNATRNDVTRFTLDNDSAANSSQATFVERVFGNLSESEEDAVIVAPVRPIAPFDGDSRGGSTTTGLFGPETQSVTLTYLGTETIAGRETHGVRLTPTNASESDAPPTDGSEGNAAQHVENATYWFDAEYFHPLRTETMVRVDGEVTRTTQVYRNVSFNVNPDPATFQFDPPANATVRSGPEPATFDSAAAAAANVSFAAADADPPERFDFETAVLTRLGNRTTVAVQYTNGTDFLAISSRRPPFEGRDNVCCSLLPVLAATGGGDHR
ncbi:MAG: outer membrane lipoprotein carrier protein LolA [Halobacteriales archaeon]